MVPPALTPRQRDVLRRFFERNPHPPWMTDHRYFQNSGFGEED